MGAELAINNSTYRLLYLQPEPEQGERVCVAIVFDERDTRPSLLFDPDFSRVKCLAPQIDTALLRFYVADMQQRIRDLESVERCLEGMGAHFVASAPRRLRATLDDRARLSLLQRFVGPQAVDKEPLAAPAESSPRPDAKVSQAIASFIEFRARGGHVIENASPREIFGLRGPVGVRPVAAAVVGRDRIALVDGVDLRLASATKTTTRAGKVVKTFWQYGRFKTQRRLGAEARTLSRIGVVLTGTSPMTDDKQEAHDFAVDLLGKESDLVIATDRPGDIERLEAALQEVGGVR